MLLPEHEKFHKLGPVDTFKKEDRAMSIQVARQTSTTGEQIVMECPVFASDTRDELNARLQMCYSIMQDRLEEENKALLRLQDEAKKRKAEAEAAEKAKEEQRHQERLARADEIAARKKGRHLGVADKTPEA